MSPKNNTNVRSITQSALRWGFGLLGSLRPSLAAALAERLFRSPPPRKRSEREKEILASAQRFEIGAEDDRLVAWRWGHGPGVLLVHGWGGSGGQLYPFVSPLLQKGYSVVTFDAPAHGDSSGSLSSLVQFADAIQRVDAELGPFHALVTHSMGGAASSLAMAKGFKTDRAVYIAPPADALEWFLKFSRALNLSKKVEDLARLRMERRLAMQFDQLNAWVLAPYVPVPLRIIHDRFDKEVPWMDGSTIAVTTSGAELTTTEGLGHRRILKEPKVIGEAVRFVADEPSEIPRESLRPDRCARCGNFLEDPIDLSEGMCSSCELDLELFNPAVRLGHDLHFNL